jgi:hypothetical protein
MTDGNIVALSQGRVKLIAQPLKKLDPATGTATAVWFGDKVLKDYPKGTILNVLNQEFKKNAPNGRPLNEQVYGSWECFDRAYWAANTLRCNLPGTPVAIGTTGLGMVGGKEEDHAVIYFYTWDGKNWIPTCYDPQRGEINDFKPKSAVFMPIFRPNFDPTNIYGLKEKKVLPPFDIQFKLNETLSGWTMLYEAENGYDVSHFDEIKNKLNNGAFPSCQPPMNTYFLTREDKTFFLYNQIRGTYRHSAVGFAWGTKRKENDPKKKDSAVIVLWKDANDCMFWCPDEGKEIKNDEFDVRFVLG